MFTNYFISNFKCFGELQSVDLRPITLIFGQNSSGKSSIIQSFLLLKQSIDPNVNETGKPIFRGGDVDLGSFLSAVHNHDINNVMQIGFGFDKPLPRIGKPRFRMGRGMSDKRNRCISFFFEGVKNKKTSVGTMHSVKLTGIGIGLLNPNYGKYKDECNFQDDVNLHYKVLKIPSNKLHRIERMIGDKNEMFSLADKSSLTQYTEYFHNLLENEIKEKGAHPDLFEELNELEQRLRHLQKERNKSISDNVKLHRLNEEIQLIERRIKKVKDTQYELPDISSTRRFLKYLSFNKNGLLPGWPMFRAGSKGDEENYRYWRRHHTPGESLPSVVGYEFSEEILNTSHLGPLRTPPSRHYVIADVSSTTVGSEGKNMPEIILQNSEKGLETEISNWFTKFEIPYSLRITHIGDDITGQMVSLNLVDNKTNLKVGPSDVGFGIGQLLPIIVEGVAFNQRTICVEQPEIHLHPKLQAHLADFFIATSLQEDNIGNQWIVETHSETLMLRMQRRIREGVLSCDDVSVLYVKSHTEIGGSEIIQLRLDDDGEFIDEWPDGFFEEGYDEIFGSE